MTRPLSESDPHPFQWWPDSFPTTLLKRPEPFPTMTRLLSESDLNPFRWWPDSYPKAARTLSDDDPTTPRKRTEPFPTMNRPLSDMRPYPNATRTLSDDDPKLSTNRNAPRTMGTQGATNAANEDCLGPHRTSKVRVSMVRNYHHFKDLVVVSSSN